MIHRFNLYYDAIYPFLCKLVGKRYGCCNKIKNCTKCKKARMEADDETG